LPKALIQYSGDPSLGEGREEVRAQVLKYRFLRGTTTCHTFRTSHQIPTTYCYKRLGSTIWVPVVLCLSR